MRVPKLIERQTIWLKRATGELFSIDLLAPNCGYDASEVLWIECTDGSFINGFGGRAGRVDQL